MKVIIAGGRDITDFEVICLAYSAWNKQVEGLHATEIVSGMARGVDTLAVEFANRYTLPIKPFPANWDKYGRAAGPIRNEQMAKYADTAIIIMKNGGSRGSLNMKSQMEKLNKPVFVYELAK